MCVSSGFGFHPAIPGRGVRVCVFLCALRLYPDIPGSILRRGCVCLGLGFNCAPAFLARLVGCVFWCARSVCTPPILTGVCGVGVCAWAEVLAATPFLAWVSGCVCWCARSTSIPPDLAGVPGVCVCVCLDFGSRAASPGWGLGICVFVCPVRLYPPILSGVCGAGVCAWAPVSAPPCHSWLGCWGVCVLMCALHFYPASPGWCSCCVCMSVGVLAVTPPVLAGVFG